MELKAVSEGLGMRVQAGLTIYIAKTKLVILTTCMQSGTPVTVKLWFYCVLETNWIRQPEKQVPY